MAETCVLGKDQTALTAVLLTDQVITALAALVYTLVSGWFVFNFLRCRLQLKFRALLLFNALLLIVSGGTYDLLFPLLLTSMAVGVSAAFLEASGVLSLNCQLFSVAFWIRYFSLFLLFFALLKPMYIWLGVMRAKNKALWGGLVALEVLSVVSFILHYVVQSFYINPDSEKTNLWIPALIFNVLIIICSVTAIVAYLTFSFKMWSCLRQERYLALELQERMSESLIHHQDTPVKATNVKTFGKAILTSIGVCVQLGLYCIIFISLSVADVQDSKTNQHFHQQKWLVLVIDIVATLLHVLTAVHSVSIALMRKK